MWTSTHQYKAGGTVITKEVRYRHSEIISGDKTRVKTKYPKMFCAAVLLVKCADKMKVQRKYIWAHVYEEQKEQIKLTKDCPYF